MTGVWNERAEAFRSSETHRAGPDLDLLVEWCEPRPGVRALDVASGGGHVARRLREAGCDVLTVDPAPGMQADVVARADHLPFADDSFEVVTCRLAAHHFDDVTAAVRELTRVTRRLVVVEDNLFLDEDVEQAERLRDPMHVRCYGEAEWEQFFAIAGLTVDRSRVFERRLDVDAWLARVETPPDDADRVRQLLAGRIDDGAVTLRSLVLRGVKGR